MATATWKARTSLIPVIGLLALAGMLSGAGPAWAQLECPLPEGVTPPAAPRVTAQQVEDGSASLADFALAAKEQYVNASRGITTVRQAAYTACLVRQEGSPWRSGSTYLVQLTPDGRVFIHAKDMSLSGRQLKPAIYGAVLHALGISPAALADPAAAFAAFAAAAAGDGGPFNVAALPDASGYANVYVSVNLQVPILLLAGIDLGEPHLVAVSDEDIDYGDPATTAEDVVDRETLKAFVTAAGEYVIGLLDSEDLAAASKARIALRDANGPWKHGPVYVAVMERASRLIVFHGAFPDRFEFRQGGIARDVATGELVVEQLIRAAESGPQGGFWLYHFDNPADDTDSAETPKVGYARIFTRYGSLPDGTIVPTDYIVNSGFYLTPDGVVRPASAGRPGRRADLDPVRHHHAGGRGRRVRRRGGRFGHGRAHRYGPLRLSTGRPFGRTLHLSRRRHQPRRHGLVHLGHPGPAGRRLRVRRPVHGRRRHQRHLRQHRGERR